MKPSNRGELAALAAVFFKLGCLAFGGPAAHVAMMRQEVVAKRRWMTDERLMDLYGATNFIPGPNSTELALHVGFERAGVAGLLVAGACFIVPAAAITLLCTHIYMRYGSVPWLEEAFYGIKPAILAVVVGAIVKLAKPVMKSVDRAVVGGAICVAAMATSIHELLLLAAGTLVGVLVWRREKKEDAPLPPKPKGRTVALAPALAAATLAKPTALSLFLAFLKIGSILYGSGYVLLAFLRSDLVERRHWLNGNQLLDLVALGQITPGPVFTTATAIGWFLGGLGGAVGATIGIFAPAFVLVGVTHDLVARMRRSRWLGGALDGVNVASLALMAAVVVQLARGALVDVPTWIIAVVAALVAVATKWNATWSVLGGAIAGIAVHHLRLR